MHSVLLTTSLIETRHPSIDDANVYWEVVVKEERFLRTLAGRYLHTIPFVKEAGGRNRTSETVC
jgi:hypothetical protein